MARSESKSISDSFGESMERAGYERANDSRGGWQEHESSDDYESTRDRMSRHLASRGKSNDVNQSISNPINTGFGGRSAISQSIGTHYQSNAAASSVVSGGKRSLANGFGRDVAKNAPYSPRQDWDNVNFFTSQDRIRDIAHHNTKASLDREGKGNAVGSFVGNMVGSFVDPTSLGEAAVTAGTQLGLTKLGTGLDKALNREEETLGKMTPGQRAIYNAESQKVRDAYQEDMDSLGSRAAGWGATAAGIVGSLATGGAGGTFLGSAANAFADKYRHNSAMKHAAETLNSPVLKAEIQEDAIKTAQAFKENERMRRAAGNTEYVKNQGVLGAMQQRINSGKNKQEDDYSIPQLVNLWNNISVI
jgi:hypothetical protein